MTMSGGRGGAAEAFFFFTLLDLFRKSILSCSWWLMSGSFSGVQLFSVWCGFMVVCLPSWVQILVLHGSAFFLFDSGRFGVLMGFGYESCDVVGGVGDGGVPFDSGGVLTWWRFRSVVVLLWCS
jgi:hypothetical protein